MQLGYLRQMQMEMFKALPSLFFTTYVWPFEVVSALLITAALGAMVLAHHHNTKFTSYSTPTFN